MASSELGTNYSGHKGIGSEERRRVSDASIDDRRREPTLKNVEIRVAAGRVYAMQDSNISVILRQACCETLFNASFK